MLEDMILELILGKNDKLTGFIWKTLVRTCINMLNDHRRGLLFLYT